MKFKIPASDSTVVAGQGAIGDPFYKVDGVASLDNADLTCLSFCTSTDPQFVSERKVGILLVDLKLKDTLTFFNSRCVVFCDSPKFRFLQLLNVFFSDTFTDEVLEGIGGISRYAYVENGTRLGRNVEIYPNVSIFKSVEIGNDSIIQSGSVIGGNGLGDVEFGGRFHKFVHLGGVVIGQNVHIGCNVIVLRGMLENTIIESGCRIGNNVTIGHNVVVEQNCYISSGVTIGGASVIRKGSWLAPGATLTDHVEVGEGTMIGTGAVLIKDALPNSLYLGNPARKISDRYR